MAEKREEGRMCAWKRTAYQVKRLGGNKLKKKTLGSSSGTLFRTLSKRTRWLNRSTNLFKSVQY
jgi:hypothetical protein